MTIMTTIVRFGKNFLLSGLLFGLAMGVLFALLQGAASGFAFGVASGVVFGLTMAIIIEGMHRRTKTVQAKELKGEHVLRGGLANHMVRGEGVGGWLFLTDKDLYFVSHKFNVQRHKQAMPLKDISEVSTHLTGGIVPNGLKVKTTNGDETFVVNRSKSWKKDIDRARGNA